MNVIICLPNGAQCTDKCQFGVTTHEYKIAIFNA
jgi:hypothetical protein